MSAEHELRDLYAEWRRLAEAEGKAIREGNWEFVAQCQKAISQLPPRIDRLTGQARDLANASSDARTPKLERRSTVLDLIELQRRNLASLQERRLKLSAHVEQLSRAGRNLRGIQRSYAPAATPAWSSYS
jgi:hypothetical protein